LMEAGKELNIKPYGIRAMNSLRVEKSYKLVGTELSIEYSPYESGLDRFVHPNKGDFIGLAALNRWREKGFSNKLVTMEVQGVSDADVLGNNPIYSDDSVVGRATGGDFGFRLNKSIALGMVKPDLANVGQDLKIDILGKMHKVSIIEDSPYDPENKLLRAWMKILVVVKRVIDYNVQVRVKEDGTGVHTDNVKMATNPPDDNAVEEAVKIKESGKAKEVVAVTIGEEKAQETVRKALAVGADRGIHVKTDSYVEPLGVAKILKKIVEKEKPDLVFMGKQAIDDDCNQTGQMLAAMLGWAQGTFVSKVELKDKVIVVIREVDEGLETVEINLPAVVTCDLRLNEPRYASLPNIMKAKKKPIEQLIAKNLDVDISNRIEQLKVEEPPKRRSGIKVTSVAELVSKLKNEAKVI